MATKIRDTKDMIRSLSAGLKVSAQRPNIFGYQPHDKQIDFHSADTQGRLFIGGNRSGKTVGGATESIMWCIGKHPYIQTPEAPVRGRVVSVDFLNGVEKIVKPEIARWVPKSMLKGGSWESAYDKELRTLNFENGSFIEFMSYDQDLDKFAGTSRHFIWFDEEPPKEIFDECLMRLIDTGGYWWITMTPVEGMTWIYDDIFLKGQTSERIHVTEVDTTENPAINSVEIEALMEGLTKDEKEARLHGRFVQRGGLIYPNFSEKNLLDPFYPPADWLHFCMMDHGFNNATVWLWAAVDRDGRMVVYDEHYKRREVVAWHAARYHEINERHFQKGVPYPAYNVGDPSIRNTDPITGTSVQIEYIENGVPIVLGNNDVKAGIDLVANRLGDAELPPRLFFTRNCEMTIWEAQRYRWATWATKKHNFEKNPKEEPHKKDDHCMDALKYGVASRPQVEDQSIPEEVSSMGYPEAADPYAGRVDEGLRESSKRNAVDEYLGSEY